MFKKIAKIFFWSYLVFLLFIPLLEFIYVTITPCPYNNEPWCYDTFYENVFWPCVIYAVFSLPIVFPLFISFLLYCQATKSHEQTQANIQASTQLGDEIHSTTKKTESELDALE